MKIKDFWYYRSLMSRLNNLWCTNNNKILKLQSHQYNPLIKPIACRAAFYSDHSNWLIDNINILKLENDDDSVAHELARRHPHWTTTDFNILNLKDKNNYSIKDTLIRYGKL